MGATTCTAKSGPGCALPEPDWLEDQVDTCCELEDVADTKEIWEITGRPLRVQDWGSTSADSIKECHKPDVEDVQVRSDLQHQIEGSESQEVKLNLDRRIQALEIWLEKQSHATPNSQVGNVEKPSEQQFRNRQLPARPDLCKMMAGQPSQMPTWHCASYSPPSNGACGSTDSLQTAAAPHQVSPMPICTLNAYSSSSLAATPASSSAYSSWSENQPAGQYHLQPKIPESSRAMLGTCTTSTSTASSTSTQFSSRRHQGANTDHGQQVNKFLMHINSPTYSPQKFREACAAAMTPRGFTGRNQLVEGDLDSTRPYVATQHLEYVPLSY